MRIIGCDLHARQQTIAMLDTTTGEMSTLTLMHEGKEVREFYSTASAPGASGYRSHRIDAVVSEPDGGVGNPVPSRGSRQIRAAEPRKQKQDRRDAELILKLLVEDRFPAIWLPSKELLDLRALLLHRHQWVSIRTRIQNALQAMALANGLRRGPGLWSYDGQAKIAFLPLPPHASYRRSALQALYQKMEEEIENLTKQIAEQAEQRSGAQLLMTHPGVGPVTALATDVFLGDPGRFMDGKALASYVGIIPGSTPVEESSGSVESRSRAVRCCGFFGVKPVLMRYAKIRSCSVSIGANWCRKVWGRRVWR